MAAAERSALNPQNASQYRSEIGSANHQCCNSQCESSTVTSDMHGQTEQNLETSAVSRHHTVQSAFWPWKLTHVAHEPINCQAAWPIAATYIAKMHNLTLFMMHVDSSSCIQRAA